MTITLKTSQDREIKAEQKYGQWTVTIELALAEHSFSTSTWFANGNTTSMALHNLTMHLWSVQNACACLEQYKAHQIVLDAINDVKKLSRDLADQELGTLARTQ